MGGESNYEIHQNAYIKLILHALKHKTSSVNGVLLGRISGNGDNVEIVESVPLFHSQIGLLPPLEISLIMIEEYYADKGLSIVGYFHANERFDDFEVGNVAKNIADHIYKYFPQAALLLLDNKKLEALLKEGKDRSPVMQIARAGIAVAFSSFHEAMFTYRLVMFIPTRSTVKQRRLINGDGTMSARDCVKIAMISKDWCTMVGMSKNHRLVKEGRVRKGFADKIIHLFVVDETYLTIYTHNILHHIETYHIDCEVTSDNELVIGDYNFDVDAPSDVEYDEEGLEVIGDFSGHANMPNGNQAHSQNPLRQAVIKKSNNELSGMSSLASYERVPIDRRPENFELQILLGVVLELLMNKALLDNYILYTKELSRSWKLVGADASGPLKIKEPSANIVLLDYVSSGRWKDIVDFDDHLDDISKDWLNPELFK
ncbi:hypothetical protein HAX54_019095 [Datura stramonium]|uniref:MPN domain-containing protein n=1 Tax=Datura stramonium TaxID=4076 RepID=A0ABS8S1L9_DATST|nr:hypothetical protein [Datura stramonium]